NVLKEPAVRASNWIGLTVSQLIARNPENARRYQPLMIELLQDENAEVRLRGACLLARLPETKDPRALPVLIEALHLTGLRDPTAYDPVFVPQENTTYMREGDKFHDEISRLESIQALRDFGPAA